MEHDSAEINGKTIALFIDSDNFSAKYFDILFKQLAPCGKITYKRIYGDFTTVQKHKLGDDILKYGLSPMQQYCYTSGKNATDSSMIIDAMDILYKKNTDCICLATSDSDFTRLAARFKEEGHTVIAAGEQKTPSAFKVICDKFIPVDVLLGDEAASLKLEHVIENMKTIIAANADEDGWAHFAAVMDTLYKQHNDFSPQNYKSDKKPFIFFAELPKKPFECKNIKMVPYIKLRQAKKTD